MDISAVGGVGSAAAIQFNAPVALVAQPMAAVSASPSAVVSLSSEGLSLQAMTAFQDAFALLLRPGADENSLGLFVSTFNQLQFTLATAGGGNPVLEALLLQLLAAMSSTTQAGNFLVLGENGMLTLDAVVLRSSSGGAASAISQLAGGMSGLAGQLGVAVQGFSAAAGMAAGGGAAVAA